MTKATRWPPFQVVAYGCEFMVRCAECGDLAQVHGESYGRFVGRDHQRYTHATEDEATADRIRAVEWDLPGCTRCGHEDHESRDCPTVTPDLLKGAS